jgi:DNA helicase-2/ATP-dependent DNA helicase PcrA
MAPANADNSAGTGLVEVVAWCPPPEGSDNPLAAELAVDVPWPPPFDDAAAERRHRAADLVRAASGEEPAEPTAAELTAAERRQVAAWDQEAAVLLDELRRSRTRTREVPLPRRLTTSQVVMLAHDPDELAAALARPVPVRPLPQARRGSRFHRWVEELYAAAPLLEPDDLPGAGDEDLSDAELAEFQDRFLAAGWGERRPVAVEAAFELVVAGRLLRGRIDAIYPTDDGGYDVIDFKTGRVPADFAAASLQLAVYRLAWADLVGVDPAGVDAGFLYVRTGELKRPDRLLDRDELAALLTGT